ncbi:hypothetical protein [Novosphingobium sp. Gsoil 351]|uniref:hypothetical protein n=1 Tax=Novosphingobium sp. Gsoil 351 TaxID=2675225 RepID=UPI001E45A9A5|nr:hypothetical protein [Novosphingobium sp. Gsoil 351]
MAKAVRDHRNTFTRSTDVRSDSPRAAAHPCDWRKAMSDNVAYALLVYTALQIFMTIGAMKKFTQGSILPYFSLIVLVAAIIPACRRFERRWEKLSDDQAADASLRGYYRRDQAFLWLLAIGLPFVLTGLILGIERIG